MVQSGSNNPGNKTYLYNMKMYPVPIDIVAEVNRMFGVKYESDLALQRMRNAFFKKLESHELYDLIEPVKTVAQKFKDCEDLGDFCDVIDELKDTCEFYKITLKQ